MLLYSKTCCLSLLSLEYGHMGLGSRGWNPLFYQAKEINNLGQNIIFHGKNHVMSVCQLGKIAGRPPLPFGMSTHTPVSEIYFGHLD